MFSNSNIKTHNASNLIDDPLAGCLSVIQDEINARNFLGSILLRLRLFHSEKICNRLAEQIISESDHVTINRWEYVINEVLYELRKPQKKFDGMYEAVVINDWATDLMKRYDQDRVLDFIGAVRKNRSKRSY